jgi:quercetin dioxygenase-like cupin family protein
MQATLMDAMSELWRDEDTLSLDAAPFQTRDKDGLAQLLEIGRRAVEVLQQHCRRRSPDGRALFAGQLPGWIEGVKLRAFMHRIELEHPIHPEAPFEGTSRIAGAAWLASREFGEDVADGIAKLCFAPNTAELPLHTHEQSERFIFCLHGRGTFHYTKTMLDDFDGGETKEVCIRAGSFVLFSRQVLHTFSASRPGMVLVSYQSPSLAFDDPDQYTLPNVPWTLGRCSLDRATRNRAMLASMSSGGEADIGSVSAR